MRRARRRPSIATQSHSGPGLCTAGSRRRVTGKVAAGDRSRVVRRGDHSAATGAARDRVEILRPRSN